MKTARPPVGQRAHTLQRGYIDKTGFLTTKTNFGGFANLVSNDIRTGFAVADDGIQLYWRAIGPSLPPTPKPDSPSPQRPVLVCNNGVGVSTFFWKYVVANFRDRFTVLLWDYRGHGRSSRKIDPHTADLSVQRHTRDLHTVLQDAFPDAPPILLVGHSMGCQVCLEFYRLAPAQVAGMVLMLGTAGRALDTFFDWNGSPAVFRALHRMIFSMGPAINEIMRPALHSPLTWPVASALYLVDPLYTRRQDLLLYTRHIASLDARVFIESVCQLNEHSAWDLLPDLNRPVLVIAAEKDTFTPLWLSRKMVDTLPTADLLVLADASHAALIEQPETINHRVERFLREQVLSA